MDELAAEKARDGPARNPRVKNDNYTRDNLTRKQDGSKLDLIWKFLPHLVQSLYQIDSLRKCNLEI